MLQFKQEKTMSLIFHTLNRRNFRFGRMQG